MANREFKIQSDTISLNGVPLSSSFDGKVVLPGVTRATGYVVKEVDEVDGDEVNTSFNSQTVMVIDNAQYNFYANIATPSPQYIAAQYIVELDDDGEIDGINVDVPGLYSDADRSLALGGLMWITDVAGATDNFNTNDWVQIPFLPKFQAGAVESEIGGDTGGITFEDNNIIGSGEDSGDGNGFGTIRLVPDADLIENDQYLIIDPTAPGHIHIRAGGTQDASNADLMLGGEKNYVRVRDNQGVRLQNQRLVENFYFHESPTSFTSSSWYEDNGSFYVEFTTTDPNMLNHFWEFTNGGPNRIVINQNDTLEYGGWAASQGNDVYKVQVNTGPVSSPTSVNILEFQLFTTETNNIILESGDFRVDVYDDIRMFGRDIFRFVNYSNEEPIEITTNYENSSYTWSFNPNGTLNFPDGSTQTTAYTGATPDTDTLDSVTTRGAITTNTITVSAVITTDITNKLSPEAGSRIPGIRPPDGAGANNGYVWVPDETQISSLGDITGWTLTNSDGVFSTTVVQMRNDLGASWAIETADPLIYTGTYTFTSPDYAPSEPLPVNVNVNANTWTFGTDGTLTFPNGDLTFSGNKIMGSNNSLILKAYPDNNSNRLWGAELYYSFDNDTHIRPLDRKKGIALGFGYGTNGSSIRVEGSEGQNEQPNTGDRVAIVAARNQIDYVFIDGIDFTNEITLVDGITFIAGVSQRNETELEVDLFVPSPSELNTKLLSLTVGNTVIVTYHADGASKTITGTVSQVVNQIAQTDPANPTFSRKSFRILGTLPVDYDYITEVNFPDYTANRSAEWVFNNDAKLTLPGTLEFSNGTLVSGGGVLNPPESSYIVSTQRYQSASGVATPLSTTNLLVVDTSEVDDIVAVQVGWQFNSGTVEAPIWNDVTNVDNSTPGVYRITVVGIEFTDGVTYTFRNPVPVAYDWSFGPVGELTTPGLGTITHQNNDLKIEVSGTDVIVLRTAGGDLVVPASGGLQFNDGTTQTTAYLQAQYDYLIDGTNTPWAVSEVNMSLINVTPAAGYSGSDTHTINLPAGVSAQRLVIVNASTLCSVSVDGLHTINPGSAAEFIYAGGLYGSGWVPLYGTV